MRFNKISFENYRCFLNGSIEFKRDAKRNMTILIGPNGGGKTETLFAFWWTLYDYDFSKLTNKEQTPYALNSELYRSLEQSTVGTIEICSVTLEFEESGINYQVKKWCEYKKTEKQVKFDEFREFSYYKENGELTLPIRDSDMITKKLTRIIPKNILYGIIFDGERMQRLNTPDENSVNAIRGVISDITNVDLLENCSVNFNAIKRKLNKSLKQQERRNGHRSLDEIINEEDKKSTQFTKLSNQLEQYQVDKDKILFELENISELLEKNKEVQNIEKDRKVQRESLVKYEKNLDSYYKNFSATLRDGYLLASEKLLNDVENTIRTYDVPQNLTVSAVESILSRSSCICGNDMDDDAIAKLRKLQSLLPPDNINSTLSEVVRQMKQRISDVKEQAKQNYGLIQNCETEIKDCKETIASLSTMITSMDDTGGSSAEAIRLEKENERATLRKGFLLIEIPKLESTLEELSTEIKRLRELRDSIVSDSKHSKKINSQITYVEKCISALDRIKDINKKTALENINSNLEDAYSLLSEDAERGRKIRIIQHNSDRRYQIVVYMQDDFQRLVDKWKNDGTYQHMIGKGRTDEEIEEEAILKCIDSNSTGQSKINTFAFVKAILDYSNSSKNDDGIEVKKEYPLLIDAPFGDISAGNLRKSSSELHNFARQVILMIDEDKYLSLRKSFEPYTESKYIFKKAKDRNHSIINLMED